MKMIEVSPDFYNAALELANYVEQFQNEEEDFRRHIKEGNLPSGHIYSSAAIVGGWEDSIQEIVDEVEEECKWQESCHCD